MEEGRFSVIYYVLHTPPEKLLGFSSECSQEVVA